MPTDNRDPINDPVVPYECERCGEKFFSYKGYKNHMTDHIMQDDEEERRGVASFPNVYQCAICAKEFRYKMQLTGHFNTVHANTLNKAKPILKDLSRRLSSGKFPLYSEDKELSPSAKRELRAVDVTFKRNYEHNGNYNIVYKGAERTRLTGRFGCPDCNREFLNHDQLDDHVNKYKGKKVYKCNFCIKQFHYRTSWKRHEECHKTERQVWECDTCTLTFTQKVNLKRHKEGNKHPCGSAGRMMSMRMFQERPVLQCLKPVSTDTPGRYPVSDEDDEEELEEDEDETEEDRVEVKHSTPEPSTASSIEGSTAHIRKGEGFYQCGICDKLFTYRSLCSRHEKEHHSSKNFDCSFCGQKFTRQYYLARHRKVCLSKVTKQTPEQAKYRVAGSVPIVIGRKYNVLD